jgi:hypothetical protein
MRAWKGLKKLPVSEVPDDFIHRKAAELKK